MSSKRDLFQTSHCFQQFQSPLPFSINWIVSTLIKVLRAIRSSCVLCSRSESYLGVENFHVVQHAQHPGLQQEHGSFLRAAKREISTWQQGEGVWNSPISPHHLEYLIRKIILHCCGVGGSCQSKYVLMQITSSIWRIPSFLDAFFGEYASEDLVHYYISAYKPHINNGRHVYSFPFRISHGNKWADFCIIE